MEVFKELRKKNVKKHIQKKGKQDYIPWAIAWTMLKEEFPNAQRIVYENPINGLNYFDDGRTAYVKVGIIVQGLEETDYLPVMDFRNKSIPLEKITSMDVNKTIQRSTVKAIALHGLGLELWAGEDIESGDTSSVVPKKDKTKKLITLKKGDDNWTKVLSYIEQNPKSTIDTLVKNLRSKYQISKETKDELRKHLESLK